MVIGVAVVGGRGGERQVCFHTKVALGDLACCFVVSLDLTDLTEGDLVSDPIVVRQGKAEDELSIFT